LSQLLQNAPVVSVIPRPLRIADDWEERNIIEEDLKKILNSDIRTIKSKFNRLSADWETLVADGPRWELEYPDPQFLGAWRKHREVFGYVLRSELVYQLKKQIEQNPDFTLDQAFKYILVDEYQDLNRCDLQVIKRLTEGGAELFATGDDDQSIYGFRFALPQGIRNFGHDYNPSKMLKLEHCVRCDANILRLGLFVANLDPKRIAKPLKPFPEKGPGEVHLLSCGNENEEAQAVARVCRYLIQSNGVSPGDILILTRSDRHQVFSGILKMALMEAGIPVACQSSTDNLFNEVDARVFLSVLRLSANPNDHLAWRTLLQVRSNGIGDETFLRLYELAVNKGTTFVEALRIIEDSPKYLGNRQSVFCRELGGIRNLVRGYSGKTEGKDELLALLEKIGGNLIRNSEVKEALILNLQKIIEVTGAKDTKGLLSVMSASLGDKEQEIDPNCINILTMHKAKGLTADVVFIIAAEDEYIPGEQLGEEKEGDERRLLYVSLTRAKHALYITYCNRQTGPQRWTGRTSGKLKRTLSRFLIDAPIKPESASEFCQHLGDG
jgi:DNA helicase-2/ATP-dependent DNA helicase PcrA